MGVTSRWINPNAVPLTQDRFSDNGTFSAAKEGKYGYNKVSVGVETDRIFGKDPETDEDMEVREEPEQKDPYRPDEGGEGGGGGEKPPHLVETVLPSAIAVVKPPDKTRYMLGETIAYAGIGVQARLKSGQAWDGFPGGMIPFKELVFPVKKLDGNYIPEYQNSGTVDVKRLGRISNLSDTIPIPDEADEGSVDGYNDATSQFWAQIRRGEKQGYAYEISQYQGFMTRDTVSAGFTEVPILVARVVAPKISPNQGETNLSDIKFNSGCAVVGHGYYSGGEPLKIDRFGYVSSYASTRDAYVGRKTGITALAWRGTIWGECNYTYTSPINAYFAPSDSSEESPIYTIDIPIYTATSDLDCGIAQPIRFSTRGVAVCAPETEGGSRHRETHFSGGCIALAPRGNAICYITASAGGGSMDIVDKWIDGDAGSESEESETVSTGSSFTHNGLTVRFTRGSVAMDGEIVSYLPDTSGDGAALLQHAGEIAWTMVYGNVAGTDKALPVQWSRPGDGKVLETEFNISVATPVE